MLQFNISSSLHFLLHLPSLRNVSLLILTLIILWLIYYYVYRPLTSPLRGLKCPPGGKTMKGHFNDMTSYYNGRTIDRWVETLGSTFMVRGFCFVNHRLFTMDPRAIQYIMSNPDTYQKPDLLIRVMRRYMKEGLLIAEEQRHQVQRKIVSKLFSSTALKGMAQVVDAKTKQLSDILHDLCADPNLPYPFATLPTPPDQPPNTRVIDVYGAASRSTYDIIGKLAIDHDFDSLNKPGGPGGELFDKYAAMQQYVQGGQAGRQDLSVLFPLLDKLFPTENTIRVNAAMMPLQAMAEEKVRERLREMQEGKRSESRDLLTLMLRGNLANDTPPDMKLHDAEITGQLATFMFAGSDTTAGTIAWCLYQLAQNIEVQDRLRAECLSYGEGLVFGQMDTLPYLDAVVKETLRTNPSIPSTIRAARQNDVIPLAFPIVTEAGETISSVKIRKGQMIHIPIENLNMAASIWGPESRTFNPSRWLEPEQLSSSTTSARQGFAPNLPKDGPGVWPDVMTFIHGPRRCIGYKFALIEIKITLFVLIRGLVFSAVPGKRIYKSNMFSTRPYVENELRTVGWSLPIMIRPYKG